MLVMDKKFSTLLGILLGLLASSSYADWDVLGPQEVVAKDEFFQISRSRDPMPQLTAPATMLSNHKLSSDNARTFYSMSISGSLKQNLEKIVQRYHWQLIWKAPYDYRFHGRFVGTNMPDVMEQLLKLFPLRAVVYMANKTILIVPRHR